MNIIEAMGLSVLGMAIVFAILVLLMAIIYLLSVIFGNKQPESMKDTAIKTTAAVTEPPVPAPGSAGEVSIFDVPDKEAAMIMAIIADKLDAPLNELHFKSIREVK